MLGPLSLAANAQIAIPRGTTDQRPSSPTAGMMRYNTTLNVWEYYNNTEWVSMPLGSSNDGSTAETAATSAKQLFDDGIVTSGKLDLFVHLLVLKKFIAILIHKMKMVIVVGC